MRKVIRMCIWVLILSMIFTGCAQKPKQEVKDDPIKVGTLKGPTGMGMVGLMDQKDVYEISMFQSPDELVAKVINKEVDLAAMPTNLASILYHKTKGEIKLLGVNTLGVLYIVENGSSVKEIKDLKGKTIIASGKGAVPEYVLESILKKNGLKVGKDVSIEYKANHTEVATLVASNEKTVAMLPQPFVTTVTMKNKNVNIALDLNQEWEKAYDTKLPIGALVINKEFYSKHKKGVEAFLEDYEASVDFVHKKSDEASLKMEEYKILPNQKIAKIAIPKSNIVWIKAEDAKDSLTSFYKILLTFNKKSIGGKLPDEDFYVVQP